MHARFTRSPFWPKDVTEFMIHNSAFGADRAEEEKEALVRKIADVEAMKANSRMFFCSEGEEEWRRSHGVVGICMPELLSKEESEVKETVAAEKEPKTKGTGAAKDDTGELVDLQKLTEDVLNASGEEVMTLREKVEKAVVSHMGKVTIKALKNGNADKGLSKVLALPTKYWRGNEEALICGERGTSTAECRAYWPSGAELKFEGEERFRYKGSRRLPAPRLDFYSQFFVEHYLRNVDRKDRVAMKNKLRALCQNSGEAIDPQYRHIAEFEGPIDYLESIKIRYDEEDAEKFVDAVQPIVQGVLEVQADLSGGDWDESGAEFSAYGFQSNGSDTINFQGNAMEMANFQSNGASVVNFQDQMGLVNYHTNGYPLNGNSFKTVNYQMNDYIANDNTCGTNSYQDNGYSENADGVQFYDFTQNSVGHGFSLDNMEYAQEYSNNHWISGMAYDSNPMYNNDMDGMQYAHTYNNSGSQGVDAEIAYELGVTNFDHDTSQDFTFTAPSANANAHEFNVSAPQFHATVEEYIENVDYEQATHFEDTSSNSALDEHVFDEAALRQQVGWDDLLDSL